MNTINFSIVIPVHNRVHTLPICIDSILSQTYPNFELILVDDHSSDGSVKLIKKYQKKDKRIVLIEQPDGKNGAQAARNTGILNAKYDWLMFNDSDDTWVPNKIEKQLELLANVDFDQYTVLYSNCIKIDSKTGFQEYWDLPSFHSSNQYSSLLLNPGPMFQSLLCSKKHISEISYLDETVPSFQEWDTSIRLAKKGVFYHLKEPLYYYYVGSNDAMSKSVEKNLIGLCNIYNKYKNEIISIHGKKKYKELLAKCIKYELPRVCFEELVLKEPILQLFKKTLIQFFGNDYIHNCEIYFKIKKIQDYVKSPRTTLKKILKKIKYSIKKVINLPSPTITTLIKNIYKTNYSKRVLLSYITASWTSNNIKSHTNFMECKTIGDIFNELGYQVDAILYDDSTPINYMEYDVVFGMSYNLDRAFEANPKAIKIYYGTGCSSIYQNIETLKKIQNYKKHSNKFAFSSGRYLPVQEDKQSFLSDKIIVLGNKFTTSTYTRYDSDSSRYCYLPGFFYKTTNINLDKKDFEKSKSNFVWFGSAGVLHKGLDLVLELFLQNRNLNLYICGASDNEKEFWDYYKPLIANSPNIHNLGFLNIESEQFSNLMYNSLFAIFPSVSEGCSPALLTLMGNGGLIPITSVRAGVDLPKEFPLISEKNCIEEYEKLIKEYMKKDKTELKLLSKKIYKYVNKTFTYENYRKNMFRILKETLN